ncbi:MAG: hypothetical protein HY916_09085 [Desulfovibrio sp.]|jgi:hypothetical protein|nr:hypothetical protein [Desulfovibrio sp.]
MPDRYGRVGGDDFLLAARGLRELNEGTRREEDERQLGLGLGAYTQASASGQPPQRPAGVSDINWAKATQVAQTNEQARLSMDETRYANDYLKQAGQGATPEARLNLLAGIKPTDLAGARALATVQKQVLSDQENQIALLGGIMKKGQAQYDGVFRPAVVAAKDMYDKGDEEGAANVLASLSKTLPLRGEYRWDPETKTMDHYHNERNAGLFKPEERDPDLVLSQETAPGAGMNLAGAATSGQGGGLGLGATSSPQQKTGKDGWDGYTYTRSLTVKEALDAVNKMGREEFALQMAGHRVTNIDFNAKTLESGGHMATGPQGEKLRVFPLINPDDSTRQFAVFDAKTGQSAGVLSNDEFFKSGIQVINKQQQQLDTEARKASTDERRLSLQEKALSLREDGSGGNASAAADFVKLKNQKLAAYAKEGDDPAVAEQKATEAALADFRLLPGFEDVRTAADITARSRQPKGIKKGAGTGSPPPVEQPPVSSAQSLWDSMKK